MAATVKLEIDARDFNRALKAYADTTKKGGDEIVNTAAKHLAYQAVHETRHADRSKIEALKEVNSVVVFGKTGRRLKDIAKVSKSQRERRTEYQATTSAFLIYLHQLRKMGRDPKSFADRKALMAGALKMVNARIKSVNYLRSGWLAAAKAFDSVVRGTGGLGKPNLGRKEGIGGGTISTGGKATAWIWNGSLYSKTSRAVAPGLVRYATEGLQRALAVSKAKLEQITEERMARHAKEFR